MKEIEDENGRVSHVHGSVELIVLKCYPAQKESQIQHDLCQNSSSIFIGRVSLETTWGVLGCRSQAVGMWGYRSAALFQRSG